MTTTLPSRTPVLVVGGGPVGLTSSLLLSQRGIEHVVVERRGETQRAPAAHVLRRRPMEIFERLGVAADIEAAKPELALDCITWVTSLGGVEAGRLDLRAGLVDGEDAWTNCPQNVLEPILEEHARRERAATIVRGAQCVDLQQDGDGVRATVQVDGGDPVSIDADWMIACDGAGSSVRRALGIEMIGPGPQGRFFMVHFEADLRPWLEGREGPLVWILDPATAGTFIIHDPAKSHVLMALQTGAPGEAEALPERLASALGVDVPFRILSVDSWSPHVQVAERYRAGRVFLAGDAAHRFPPTGGLGLNTGVLDVDFLVHQLARVMAGDADDDALDAYEAECRPAAEENARESFENMKRLGEIHAVLGPCPDRAAVEARIGALDADERRALDLAIEHQRSHFTSEGRLPRDPRSG